MTESLAANESWVTSTTSPPTVADGLAVAGSDGLADMEGEIDDVAGASLGAAVGVAEGAAVAGGCVGWGVTVAKGVRVGAAQATRRIATAAIAISRFIVRASCGRRAGGRCAR